LISRRPILTSELVTESAFDSRIRLSGSGEQSDQKKRLAMSVSSGVRELRKKTRPSAG